MKKPRAPFQRPDAAPRQTHAVDQAMDCCANILALAGLLEAGGTRPVHQTAEAVSRAGYLIGREAEKLRALVELWERVAARPPRRQ
jgi:hypothetical protein